MTRDFIEEGMNVFSGDALQDGVQEISRRAFNAIDKMSRKYEWKKSFFIFCCLFIIYNQQSNKLFPISILYYYCQLFVICLVFSPILFLLKNCYVYKIQIIVIKYRLCVCIPAICIMKSQG